MRLTSISIWLVTLQTQIVIQNITIKWQRIITHWSGMTLWPPAWYCDGSTCAAKTALTCQDMRESCGVLWSPVLYGFGKIDSHPISM